MLVLALMAMAQQQVTTCRTVYDRVVCTTDAPLPPTPMQLPQRPLDGYAGALGGGQNLVPDYSRQHSNQATIEAMRQRNEAMAKNLRLQRQAQCRDAALTAFQAGQDILGKSLLKNCPK